MEPDQLFSNQNLREPEARSQQISSNNSKFFVSVAASVLLTAIIAGSAVYLWQRIANERIINNLEQKITSLEEQISTMRSAEIAPQPTSPPALSPTPISDPTANWKIYKSDENGIEFKYPIEWFAKPLSGWTFQVFLENRPFEIIEGTEFMTSIGLHFNEVMNTTTKEKYFFEKTLDEGVNSIKSLYDEKSVKTDNLIIGGKKAVQVSGVIGPGMLEGHYLIDTLIQMDGHLLVVELNNKDFKDVYDRILSTLTFTN